MTIAQIKTCWRLIRGHKPIGAVLLVWPALWALWLATRGSPQWSDTAIVVVCAFLTRSAGCAINDWADRSIDSQVERTRSRPLAAGEMRPRSALILAAALLAVAFALSWWLSHRVYWLLPPALVLIAAYPFSKRVFALPQLVLSLTFAMAVPISWYAAVGEFSQQCLLLMLVTVVWVFTYDTIYALSDIKDDLRIGVRSSAVFFGDNARLAIGLFHALLMLSLWILGDSLEFTGLWWHAALLAAAASIGYQHYLIARARDGDFLRAFSHNGYVFGPIVFAALALAV